jgi:hypothetical protein
MARADWQARRAIDTPADSRRHYIISSRGGCWRR